MKKFFTLVLMLFMAFNANVAFASLSIQDVQESEYDVSQVDSEVDEEPERSAGEILTKVLEILGGIAILAALLAMVGHMIYVKYINAPRYKFEYTAEYFRNVRVEAQRSQESTDEENASVEEILSQFANDWKEITNPETGEVESYPTKKKQMKAAVSIIENVITVAPTSQNHIDVLNECASLVNTLEEREFNGSKIIMWIAGIIALLPLFAGAWIVTLSMGFGVATYYLASQTPIFMLLKHRDGKVGLIDRIIAWALGLIGAAQTVTTVTKWSDGTKTKEDDNSQHWFAWGLALIVILMLAFYLTVFSIFSYLRNYVIYW